MKVIATIGELRTALKSERLGGKSIGLVPTMGYLHIGHMELVRRSKAACRRHRGLHFRQSDPVRAE